MQILEWRGDDQASGLTRFLPAWGEGTPVAAAGLDTKIRLSKPGHIGRLRIDTDNSPAGATNYTLAIMINGVGSALNAAIANPNTFATDDEKVAVASGNELDARLVTDALSGATGKIRVQITFFD